MMSGASWKCHKSVMKLTPSLNSWGVAPLETTYLLSIFRSPEKNDTVSQREQIFFTCKQFAVLSRWLIRNSQLASAQNGSFRLKFIRAKYWACIIQQTEEVMYTLHSCLCLCWLVTLEIWFGMYMFKFYNLFTAVPEPAFEPPHFAYVWLIFSRFL